MSVPSITCTCLSCIVRTRQFICCGHSNLSGNLMSSLVRLARNHATQNFCTIDTLPFEKPRLCSERMTLRCVIRIQTCQENHLMVQLGLLCIFVAGTCRFLYKCSRRLEFVWVSKIFRSAKSRYIFVFQRFFRECGKDEGPILLFQLQVYSMLFFMVRSGSFCSPIRTRLARGNLSRCLCRLWL